MAQIYNIYCDESCHLENDGQSVMVLGAVWCPKDKTKEIALRIRDIKRRHVLSPEFEIKWIKVSPAKADFYLDIVDYFFECQELGFRSLVVPNKALLQHKLFGQTHDDWYYKMYFYLLRHVLSPTDEFRIYIDIKDTCGAEKVRKLHDVLCNNLYDFSRSIVKSLQTVRSEEVEALQLADLLIGAIAYANRGLSSNAGKLAIVESLRQRTGYSLTRSTLLKENKLNVFCWQPSEVLNA